MPTDQTKSQDWRCWWRSTTVVEEGCWYTTHEDDWHLIHKAGPKSQLHKWNLPQFPWWESLGRFQRHNAVATASVDSHVLRNGRWFHVFMYDLTCFDTKGRIVRKNTMPMTLPKKWAGNRANSFPMWSLAVKREIVQQISTKVWSITAVLPTRDSASRMTNSGDLPFKVGKNLEKVCMHRRWEKKSSWRRSNYRSPE